MTLGRGALVYGVAAVVGFLFAFLLLPRGVDDEGLEVGADEASPVAAQPCVPVNSAEQDEHAQEPEPVTPEDRGEAVGVGGNPKARRIAEALSTPGHELVGRTSPVWVQVRRVLPEEDELSVWRDEVGEMISYLKASARDTQLEISALVDTQMSLVEEMRGASLGDSVDEALQELATRLSASDGGAP